jgi:hypothetical protein
MKLKQIAEGRLSQSLQPEPIKDYMRYSQNKKHISAINQASKLA